jgi:hypothetical protein
MVRFGIVAASLALLALTVTAAAEQRTLGGGGYTLKPLVQPISTMPAPQPPASPYAMNYSQQVAQSLGVRDGGLALNPTPDHKANPYAPSVSFNGSMLRLKWRP